MTKRRPSRQQQQQQQHSTTSKHSTRSTVPVLKMALGVLLIGFFLLALLLQVQTSEAFFLSEKPTILAANWGILTQPVDLLAG